MARVTIRNILIALIAGFYAGFIWHNKPEVATARFAKHVKKTISAAALQTWATNYLATASDGPTTTLYLPDVVLRISSERQPYTLVGRSEVGVKYFDLMYDKGISREGDLMDLALADR